MSKCSVKDINSYCGRKRKNLQHFSICFVRKQSRWIISWSGAFSCFNQLKSKWHWTCQTHTDTQVQPCAHTFPVWSTTGYYWLTCLNLASSKRHSNSFSILLLYESWMTWQAFFLTYLTFLAVTEICLSPSYLLPEKPCWLVFSHFTLGFIPLTPHARPGWAAWPLESWMLDSSASQGPVLGFLLPSYCKHGQEQTLFRSKIKKRSTPTHTLVMFFFNFFSVFCLRFTNIIL